MTRAGYQALLDDVAASRADLEEMRRSVAALRERAAAVRERTGELAAHYARELDERVSLAGFWGPSVPAGPAMLDGSPVERMRVQRVAIGDPVARRFSDWLGLSHCASEASDVRDLWNRLLARESQSDDLLLGERSTVLDVPDAIVSRDASGTLRVGVNRGVDAPSRPAVLAVPRFTHAASPRKLRNFGHWLLDCAPEASVLAAVAPDAALLMPETIKPFHRWTLHELGFRDEQLVPWDGQPVAARRLVLFESAGRTGGGRPLSALMHLRARLRAGSATPQGRRVYVSRRDARKKRRWVSNEHQIEALFRSRGFEVLSMAECPLDEQARIFRETSMVAGISGAGLTNLIFSAPGTQAIVLLSDSLIRWYAESGARSQWVHGRGGPGQLAALGDSPRFYAHLAAAMEQRCHCFVGGDKMPIEALAAFLDRVLAGGA